MQQDNISRTDVLKMLTPIQEEANYTKHYFPETNRLKVFLKGGASLEVDILTGNARYEALKKRPIISRLNRLHYNPGRWWTVFFDLFAVSLIVITLSGIFINKGKKGLCGHGGIELIAGIIIPVFFMFLIPLLKNEYANNSTGDSFYFIVYS